MTQELETAAADVAGDDPADPIALARLFSAGRTLKWGATIQMVRDLLAELDAVKRELAVVSTPAPAPPTPATTSAHAEPTGIAGDAAPEQPPTTAYWSFAFQGKSPVIVQSGAAGAVFLPKDAARWYTRDEAIALAHEILRAST